MNEQQINIISDILANCLDWHFEKHDVLAEKVQEALTLNNIKIPYSDTERLVNDFFALNSIVRDSPRFIHHTWVRDWLESTGLL